ncbi:MAG: DNA polymerase III subunit delta' [Candidatus Omnitrophica bacterium]|nr:DNA polymerase III subunit delta' [Candidatus Omnitrophota bacterium]
MSFENIRGQDRAIAFLKGAIENKKVSHAYIFLGMRGVGRKLAALNFAKMMNCSALEGTEPCDRCVSCRKIDEANHPDIFVIKSEKENGSIGIDKMRDVINNIGLKPYEARKKVYIVDGAEAMTQDASNALLKTLEEPPTDSVLILIAEDLARLFRTIISRSQVVRFSPLDKSLIEGILRSDHSADEKEARVLSCLSSGSLGRALKFLDEDFDDKRSTVIDGIFKRTFFDSDFEGVSRDDFRIYLDIILTLYRDMLAVKAGAGEEALINADRAGRIRKEADNLSPEHIDEVIKQVILTQSFFDQNANAKLAMSVLGMKVEDIK